MAWNLSSIDEYTCWALLIALAFYDLCAVLTPCGPLNALVGLMQERGEPLPGLLYEAEVQGERGRPSGRRSAASSRDCDAGTDADEVTLRGGGDTADKPVVQRRGSDPYPAFAEEEDAQIGSGGGGVVLSRVTPDTSEDMQVRKVVIGDDDDDDEVPSTAGSVIKLGLGDFIFYSVLVSRASMYGWPEFFACFIIVLSGLGLTLVLLTLYKVPLPALPFSILFGVFFYFMTRYFISPFLQNISSIPIYA
jgi:presenilin 1